MTPEQPLAAQASAPPAAQAAAPPAAQAAMQTHGGDVLLANLAAFYTREDSRLAPPPGLVDSLEPSELDEQEQRLSNEVAALKAKKKEAHADLIHSSDSLKHAEHFYESTKRACVEASTP